MTISFRPPQRHNMPLLIGLSGPSGSGKTLSALYLARGLAGDKPFAFLDTENGRGQMYAEYCQPWEWGDFREPFSPARYGEEIKAADDAGYPVIVVDSASHSYMGQGGEMDMHEAEVDRLSKGNVDRRESVNWPAWNKPKQAFRALRDDVLLRTKAHLIICLRAEKRTEMVEVADPRNGNRKKKEIVPKRSISGLDVDGWESICDKSLPFELALHLLLLPSAPGVPKPMKKLPPNAAGLIPLDQPLSSDTGRELARWAAGAAEKPSKDDDKVTGLVARMLEIADQIGTRDEITSKIASNRRLAQGNVAEHIAWLEKSVAAGEAKLADRKQTEEPAFT